MNSVCARYVYTNHVTNRNAVWTRENQMISGHSILNCKYSLLLSILCCRLLLWVMRKCTRARFECDVFEGYLATSEKQNKTVHNSQGKWDNLSYQHDWIPFAGEFLCRSQIIISPGWKNILATATLTCVYNTHTHNVIVMYCSSKQYKAFAHEGTLLSSPLPEKFHRIMPFDERSIEKCPMHSSSTHQHIQCDLLKWNK